MSENKITNLSYLEEIGMGDDDLLVEMIEMFLKNTPETLKSLREYNNEQNWNKLSAEAHKFKPNLSYVGLDEARDIILTIEQTAKTEDNPDGFIGEIEQVEEICQQAYKELEQQLQELKN